MANSGREEGRKVEEEKKEKKEEKRGVRKVHGRDGGVRLEKVGEKKCRGKARYTKARQGLGRWLLLLFCWDKTC